MVLMAAVGVMKSISVVAVVSDGHCLFLDACNNWNLAKVYLADLMRCILGNV